VRSGLVFFAVWWVYDTYVGEPARVKKAIEYDIQHGIPPPVSSRERALRRKYYPDMYPKEKEPELLRQYYDVHGSPRFW